MLGSNTEEDFLLKDTNRASKGTVLHMRQQSGSGGSDHNCEVQCSPEA